MSTLCGICYYGLLVYGLLSLSFIIPSRNVPMPKHVVYSNPFTALHRTVSIQCSNYRSWMFMNNILRVPITTITNKGGVEDWLQTFLQITQKCIALQNPVHIFRFGTNHGVYTTGLTTSRIISPLGNGAPGHRQNLISLMITVTTQSPDVHIQICISDLHIQVRSRSQ